MKEACLGPGVRIHSQGVVILPINVEPAWHLQQTRGTVGSARLAAGLIFRRVPGIGDFTAFWIEWHMNVIAFVGYDHAVTPLFGYFRYPVSRQIVRSSCTRRLRGEITCNEQREGCQEYAYSTHGRNHCRAAAGPCHLKPSD